ncbi:erythrocyte membrane protein 1, PfEMP1, putative [Plasmodium sp. DRC-Itaito]|nr:erythrocyte membrane protein 1, PfEMP1, putative [Plasmodium sp. DRC-Itaito]
MAQSRNSKNESEKSSRNIFEQFSETIKKQAEKDAQKYRSSLKGNLSSRQFRAPLIIQTGNSRPPPSDPCDLNFSFHSNTPGQYNVERHPCFGRQPQRFSYEVKAECGNDKIRGNKSGLGSCAPYRRQHMCDYNLEHINVGNTRNSHDLLGNSLVTAKYEGESLSNYMKNHFQDIYNSGIRTVLARTFADIGDIVRGRDMFIPNKDDKIENRLRAIFKKIYEELEKNNKESEFHYNEDKDGNHYKLREYWCSVNRREIWKAITCSAPKEAIRYITEDGGNFTRLTRMQTKCGHKDNPPDYDYIPQRFRWMQEWSENFCMYQKHLLETMQNCENCKKGNTDCKQKVYGACRDCKDKCKEYSQFVEKWKKQFNILNEAYQEIYKNGTNSGATSSSVDEHTKNFVTKLKEKCKDIDTADKYFDKGNYCKKFKFDQTTSNGKNYAFEEAPKQYKENCDCAKNFEEVDQCPVVENECKKYNKGGCQKKPSNKNPTEWKNDFVKSNISKREAVMVPPRRRNLCFRSIKQFSDIGNIVKGDDMYDDGVSDKIKDIFQEKINKKKPFIIIKTKHYTKKKKVKELIDKCKMEIDTKGYSSVDDIKEDPCKKVLHKYDHWFNNRKVEWKNLDKKI